MSEEEPKVEDAPVANGEAAAAEKASKSSDCPPKPADRVAKPDEARLNADIGVEQEGIANLQKRMQEIKGEIDGKSRGNPAARAGVSEARQKVSQLSEQIKLIIEERNAIYNEINTAEELRKSKQEEFQKQKKNLQYTDLGKIDQAISDLERQQKSGKLTIKEERDIVAKINKLQQDKKTVREYSNNVDNFKASKDSSKMLYDRLKEKNEAVRLAKEAKDVQKKLLDDMNSKGDEGKQHIPALTKERDTVKKQIDGHYEAIRKLRDSFNQQRNSFRANAKEWRAFNEWERKQRWEEEQAWRAQKRAEREKEEADRIPWEDEMLLCDQLCEMLKRYVPQEEKAVEAKVETKHHEGATLIGKKAAEADMFMTEVMGGGKKKKGKKNKAVEKAKMILSVDILESFSKLGLAAPTSADKAGEAIDAVKAKKEYYKTAPSKKVLAEQEKARKAEEKAKKDKEEAEAKAEEKAKADAGKKAKKEAEKAEKKSAEKPSKTEAKAAPAATADAAASGEVALNITPLSETAVSVSISAGEKEEPAKPEKKTVLGGNGIVMDADDVKLDGGDASMDDFLDAFG